MNYKMEHELNRFLELFEINYEKLTLRQKKHRALDIINKYTIPERYLEGLNHEERFLRQIELIAKKRLPKTMLYKPLVTDEIANLKLPKKKSSCTDWWNSNYPNATTNESKSKITGIPIEVLDKVENKGRGAFYSSGSRPGQNSYSWGKARVNCFLMGKSTVIDGPDKNLYEQAILNKDARNWYQHLRPTNRNF